MITQDAIAVSSEVSPGRRRWLLAVASIDVLLVVSSMVALNAALPDIAVETSATQTQLTWIVDSYALALACLLLPAGALGDRYGRRGALLVGLVIFTVASAAPILWHDPAHIIVARAAAGIGAALIMPATLSLLTSAFPDDERNKAVGIWAGATGSAAIVGFLGAGGLLHFFAWESIFYGFATAGLLMLALTFTVGSSRDEAATPIDWTGAALIGTAIGVFVLGIVEAPARGWTDVVVLGLLVCGVGLAGLFTWTQLRARHPLLDVRLFAVPKFGTGAAAITLLFFAMFGFFYIVMQFVQLVMGYSALQTAFALSPLAVPMLIVSTTIHLFLPKIGLRFAVTFGLLLLAAGLLWMGSLGPEARFLDLVGPLIVSSLGLGFVTSPATAAIMTAAPEEKQGVASAVNDATREVGAAIGIAVAGSVLAGTYHSALASKLDAFPGPVRDAATDSLAAALTASREMGPDGDVLARLAQTAFVDAAGLALGVLSVTMLIGAVLLAVWAPGRDGRQWEFLRREPNLADRAPAPDQPAPGPGRHRR
ncbi:EmrB/QacA subfamily drug resistance transporter [Mycolicibacterium iranicum]|uniref:EmrB/QacA subfamily drug resistance transporter n=1 Tax=Mycolicibacterium iranicum TaxID=912594 RepID=A0A839Q209_MYCIR|nr:MFS transporter [Mycolicibacterium iranicum]MBB2989859.1 EmrB/QacA subfamily drug resistance transporter [Mycolicibacterium iranicum]